MSGRVLYKYSVTLKTSSSCSHLLQFFHVYGFYSSNDYLYVIFQLWPNDGFVQFQYIVFLTLFTVFLLIVPTVELASFSSLTHCLEGFALLCTITPKSISSSMTFYNHFFLNDVL